MKSIPERGAPAVSIIVASHNKGPFVADSVRSALAQGPCVEVIVVEDASTDESPTILRGLAQDEPRLRLIELKENRGGSHCRNVGIRHAAGQFVIFLDADDLLDPHCCAERLRVAALLPDHDLWVFPMRVFRDDPTVVETVWVPRPGDHLGNFLAHRLDWSIMQPLWRRSFLERLGGFDESFVRLQDPELHVRAMLAGARACCMPESGPDCSYRIAAERHSHGFDAAASRHAAGAIHFYRTFVEVVPSNRRPLLSGTLLASISVIDHLRRTRRLSRTSAQRLIDELVQTCEEPMHRRTLRVFDRLNRVLPLHVPGLAWTTRRLLGV
jgi:glycosyltransferase involved in cell wall biosynthesis